MQVFRFCPLSNWDFSWIQQAIRDKWAEGASAVVLSASINGLPTKLRHMSTPAFGRHL